MTSLIPGYGLIFDPCFITRSTKRRSEMSNTLDRNKRLSMLTIAAAVAGAVSMAAVAVPSAQAAKVKCYGIAKAGENDCANNAGTHSCAGQTKDDYSGQDWKTADSEQACMDMHGKLEPFEGMNKDIKM